MRPGGCLATRRTYLFAPFHAHAWPTRAVPAPFRRGVPRDASRDPVSATSIAELRPAWRRGPRDPAGTLIDMSDRPIMCMSVQGNDVVVGCSDHALYGFDATTGASGSRVVPLYCAFVCVFMLCVYLRVSCAV